MAHSQRSEGLGGAGGCRVYCSRMHATIGASLRSAIVNIGKLLVSSSLVPVFDGQYPQIPATLLSNKSLVIAKSMPFGVAQINRSATDRYAHGRESDERTQSIIGDTLLYRALAKSLEKERFCHAVNCG